jgi:hypothetical protein
LSLADFEKAASADNVAAAIRKKPVVVVIHSAHRPQPKTAHLSKPFENGLLPQSSNSGASGVFFCTELRPTGANDHGQSANHVTIASNKRREKE